MWVMIILDASVGVYGSTVHTLIGNISSANSSYRNLPMSNEYNMKSMQSFLYVYADLCKLQNCPTKTFSEGRE